MRFLSKVTTIAWKDAISELRAREIIISVLVFTMLVIIIFDFAFGTSQQSIDLTAPGMIWVTFVFAGVLSLNRSFILEREEGCLEGLMICPMSREVIYVGKMMGSLLFMLIIEFIALPMFAIFFNLTVLTAEIVAITFLATLGFVACGTLFSALAVKTKARELVLPILFLPVVLPVIIGAVRASEIALSGQSWQAMANWLQIIIAFDAIFLVVSFWIFNYVIEE